MVGTSKSEGLWTEVMGTLVEVVCRVERRVEEAVRVQFGAMGGWGEVFYPPSRHRPIEARQVVFK